MKRLGIVLGALVAIVLVAIVTIPLFVNVDKYRPEIVSAVDQKINGSFELGRLSLSLWGQVKIEIEGLSLKDASGQNIVSVKSAYFHVPLLPLLSGSPVIELNLDTPAVNIVKSRAGKLNVMTLVKAMETPPAQAPSAARASAAPAPGAPAVPAAGTSASAAKVSVPAIVTNARIGLDLHDATVEYADESQGLTTQLKDLNFVVKDFSLTHPSEISVWSDFDTRLGKTVAIKGPARIDLTLSPEISGGQLAQVSVTGKADFDGLDILVPGTFEKKGGVPANLELALTATIDGAKQGVNIEKADVRFLNAVIQSSGSVKGLPAAPIVNYRLVSNDIDLKAWTEVLPMLSQYELGGKAKLSAEVGGESNRLSYQAEFDLDGLTAKAPMLKTQPRIDGSVVIATDQVQKLDLSVKAPGNEIRISGRVLSFSAPQATFQVTSPGMDLDQLIDFKAAQVQKKSESAQAFVPTAYAERTEKAPTDLDAMLEPLRSNPMLAKTSAVIDVNLRMLKAENVQMSDVVGKLYFKDLGAGLQNFGMKVFGGAIQANMACQLKPKQPTYKFSAKVTGLDLGQAVESQMTMFKNTATGKANFEMTGEGASFNSGPAKALLKAKGSLKVTDAQLSTIDVGKMAADGIMNALSKVASKVPGVGGKSFTPPHGASKYQLISSDFGISGGKFSAPNLTGKAMPRQGIDFKGSAQVGLKDQSIDAKVQIIDTYDLLGAKEFQGGILCERGKPFVLPVGVGCTLQSPCYSYGDSARFLMKVAMNNTLGQVKSQVGSQIEDQVKKALGGGGGGTPNIGKALKGLFGN